MPRREDGRLTPIRMTIPEEATRSILQGGGLLSPEGCGWHYVDGLTEADDRGLALLWCKEPLGHNGNRTRPGGQTAWR